VFRATKLIKLTHASRVPYVSLYVATYP
jgi:hypothetical protein